MTPLTPQQNRAALLRGAGQLRVDVAKEVGVSPATLSRWSHDPAFEAAVKLARDARSDAPATAQDVLVAGLAARDDDGIDWQTRVKCAQALLQRLPVAKKDKPVVVGYMVTEDDPDDSIPVPRDDGSYDE